MSPSAAAPHPRACSPRTAPGACPAKRLGIGQYVPFIQFFFILLGGHHAVSLAWPMQVMRAYRRPSRNSSSKTGSLSRL